MSDRRWFNFGRIVDAGLRELAQMAGVKKVAIVTYLSVFMLRFADRGEVVELELHRALKQADEGTLRSNVQEGLRLQRSIPLEIRAAAEREMVEDFIHRRDLLPDQKPSECLREAKPAKPKKKRRKPRRKKR